MTYNSIKFVSVKLAVFYPHADPLRAFLDFTIDVNKFSTIGPNFDPIFQPNIRILILSAIE